MAGSSKPWIREKLAAPADGAATANAIATAIDGKRKTATPAALRAHALLLDAVLVIQPEANVSKPGHHPSGDVATSRYE